MQILGVSSENVKADGPSPHDKFAHDFCDRADLQSGEVFASGTCVNRSAVSPEP